MKYFLDTEFHEYKKKPLLGKPIDTIELISIGIVSADITKEAFAKRIGKPGTTYNLAGREYYTICKEFDLKAAWNNGWLRENVLKPIYKEFDPIKVGDKVYYNWAKQKNKLGFKGKRKVKKIYDSEGMMVVDVGLKSDYCLSHVSKISYKSLKQVINKYGKTRKQIAEEIKEFVGWKKVGFNITPNDNCSAAIKEFNLKELKPNDWYPNPEFYAYYADYDWVVFCWLFGRMIDLPKGFPMFAFDIQQLIEDNNINKEELIKEVPQEGIHNSLQDAIWNKKAFNYIQTIQNKNMNIMP